MIVILILEISASIAAYAMRNDLKGYLRSNMNDSLDVYIISAEDKEGWDNMQKTVIQKIWLLKNLDWSL